MSTILGHHISEIKPTRYRRQIILKSDLPKIKYSKKSKTNKESSGTVAAVTVETYDGYIYHWPKGLHSDVIKHYSIDPKWIKRCGWLLVNKSYVWR